MSKGKVRTLLHVAILNHKRSPSLISSKNVEMKSAVDNQKIYTIEQRIMQSIVNQ